MKTTPIQSKIDRFKSQIASEQISMETIQAAVCASFNVEHKAMLKTMRKRQFANARFASMLLCRKHIPFLIAENIAAAHGFSEHSSGLKGVQRAKDLMDVDPEFKRAVERAEKLIKS